ncbi:uncharacterized protein EI90DRAFT_1737569 [Cantharellus anzutake]|uniref:uncharacterized protein n=1 Tax=Cantharellus anzutake TaxID=1750568 RepID=UPI001902D1E5|nr:uncharacterized protein EI90DRAFT_1737569 [Cantharellus anzutake]KAF8341433.1 hypothetical protein EI90DRAFT_1737569 [Cantharellus anzutake]
MSTKLSAKRYTGDQHHRDLIQMEQAAVEQQKRNLEAERREFQQQVKQIQDQMAQQKRELSAAQITLQRQQQALQNEQLALQFAQQELQNSQHEVDQQRKENYAFKQELLQQHSTLLRAREDMARKEKERRLRRTPSEGFLEDAYPSHGTIDVLKLLGNGSSRIRRQAAKSLLECTNSGGDSVSPTIEYGILQTHFLPIIPPIIAETSSADVKEFARALLKTPSFALALVEKGQSQRVVALLKEDQPYDLSEAAKICLSSVLSRRDTSSLPSGRIIRNELAMEVEHIHSPAGLSLLQSTAEATIKDLLEDKNYDLVTKYMLHEVSEVRQAVAPYLNSTITATGSHSARLVVQGSFLSRLCQRFLLPRKSGPENREKLPSDILTLTTTYLPRLCRPLCSTDVQTTSLMVQLIFSNKPSPSSQAITGAAIEATVNAASASKGMEVRQSLVDAGLLEAIAFALSDSPGGTDAPGGSVYSFICQIIPLVGVVAAATNPSHVSSLLNLLRVEDPDASKDLISSLTECFRVTIFSEGQAAYNLASQLEPNLLAPSPEWEPILSSVLPRAFDLRWTTDPEGDGFNWDTLFAIELLKNSSSKEVRKRAGIALLTRFRASPGVINWVCKRGQHPQIIELCTSPQYDEVKRIGCELLRTPAVGSHISVSKGDFTDSRSLKTSEVYGSADLVSLVSHPDMSVRISSYVALLDAARATDNCRIQLAKAGLASALNDITLVHYKGEEQSIQFTLDMLDELFFIWMEGNGHLRDAEVLANMLAAEEEKVASKAFYLTRQSFSEDLGSRQHLRTAILSRVLTVGVEPSSFLAYAAISIAECYAFDLFKIHEFETIFGLLQHPEPRIRNAMTLSMAKALRDDQQPNNGDGKLCEHLVRAGFFELVLGLLEHKDPTKEIIDFTVRSTGLELIALAVVQYGGLRGIWSLVETHPNVSVRAAAAKAIEKISNSVAAEDRALLVGGKVSTWGDDASEKQFYLVSSVCRLVGGTSRIESHIENLCRTSFPKIALQTAVSDDLPQLVVLLK